jgi:hypothetical protein
MKRIIEPHGDRLVGVEPLEYRAVAVPANPDRISIHT